MSDLENFEELFRTVGIEYSFIDLEKENYSRPDKYPTARYVIQLGFRCNFYFDENKKFLDYAVIFK